MSIQIRLFLGYYENKEIKIHLNQSALWQKEKTLGLSTLTETNWEEKDYIGFFIPQLVNCSQIKEKEQNIKTQLQLYCPKLNLDKHSIFILSQLFIF